MRRFVILLAIGTLAAIGTFYYLKFNKGSEAVIPQMDVPTVVKVHTEESAGLCPWRDPEADRRRFFPESTSTRDETLILSHEHAAIQKKLGRSPSGEDNAIQIHRMYLREKPLGVVITRRIRGESGVIELVLAVNSNGEILGARLQRLREPIETSAFLNSAQFIGAFRGKTVDSSWVPGKEHSNIPASALTSASAILDGAHTALVLLEVGTAK